MQSTEIRPTTKNLRKATSFIDINDVSMQLKEKGLSLIDDLSKLSIPLRLPVNFDLIYEASRPVLGNRVQLFINGVMVGEISYDDEKGRRFVTADISNFLKKGLNELRFKCLVTTDRYYEDSDTAKIVIRSEGATIIRKEFSTKSSLEPFDQIWTLRIKNDSE